ncbi:hypothetical protein GCM10010256_36490 [Streptomyces coeruleorubidus]|nr:hypothetical protein GCM10010256_36490 [Streptomyces coeruleorubidus]
MTARPVTPICAVLLIRLAPKDLGIGAAVLSTSMPPSPILTCRYFVRTRGSYDVAQADTHKSPVALTRRTRPRVRRTRAPGAVRGAPPRRTTRNRGLIPAIWATGWPIAALSWPVSSAYFCPS